MKDFIQRFMLEHTDLRGEFVRLNQSFYSIIEQHYYPKPVKQFLGEVILAAVLLRGIIKLKGHLTIQLETSGAVQLLVAQCNDEYHIRAVAQYDEEADLADLEQAFERGKLVVTIMPDNRIEPYQAIVHLQHYSVTQALEFYFKQSEQIPTRLWLVVDDDIAAGLLLQKLPLSEKQQADKQLENNHWKKLLDEPEKLNFKDLLRLEPKKLLLKIYGKNKVRIFNPKSVMFHCNCSVEKMGDNIRLLGKEDTYNLLKTNRYVTVTCEFCNHEHDFDKSDVD